MLFRSKVGWLKDGEQEYAYRPDNFLWSTVWHPKLVDHPQVQIFIERIKKYGYDNLDLAIRDEVPNVYFIEDNEIDLIKIDVITLWEDNPQLYILTVLQKPE